MGAKDATSVDSGLTARQEKWFQSVRRGLEANSGKSLAAWVEIARSCPHEKPRARAKWLKTTYGLGQNHAMLVLGETFGSGEPGWDDPQTLRGALWTDPASRAILERLEAEIAELPQSICGQRKQFTAFSRKFQFAAIRPAKGGAADVGLAVAAEASARLAPAAKEGWSERLKAKTRLNGVGDIDPEVVRLLRAAWERS